ncbi:alpha-1,3-glucosidase [Aureococcus anophagefferens]|nr:alpha-1,3-glucosidase [Aureococcus anophagefferens]
MYASARQQMARMTRERNNAERRVLEYAQLNNALEEELALHRAELEKKAGAADGARSESDGLRADLEAARAARDRLEAALARERAAHEATRRDLQEAEAVVDVAAEARREQERWFDEQRRRCEDEAQELVDRAFADSSMLQEELLTRELKNMEARREMVDAQVKARDEEIQRLSELVANLTRTPSAAAASSTTTTALPATRRDGTTLPPTPRAEDAAGDAPLLSLPAAYPDETPPVHGPPLPPNFERKLDL